MIDPQLVELARGIATKHTISTVLVCAVIEQESDWNTFAVRYEPTFLKTYVAPLYSAGKISATECYTRAMSWGLCQVMGQVAREFGYDKQSLAELCDPAIGIEYGCRKLADCLTREKNDLTKSLQRWNGGSNPNYAAEVLARTTHYTTGTDASPNPG